MNMIDPAGAPEIKSGDIPSEISGALGDLADAFESHKEGYDAFKETTEERLSALEIGAPKSADTETKLQKLDREMKEQKRMIDIVATRSSRPALGRYATPNHFEHKSSFDLYVRKGMDDGLRQLEQKAYSIASDPDGGYLVPEETEVEIGKRLANISPIRSIAGIQEVSTTTYRKPFSTSGPAVGWVSETGSRSETSSSPLAELAFPTMELYAMPAATSALLDDAAVDMDAWISDEVQTAFAEQEGAAFISGDGTNQPRGFLNYPQVDETAWTWGSLGYVPTGASGDLPANDASDVLIDLIYSLKAGYRQNGTWVMNRNTQAMIRKLKDADGNYLWQPPATAGGQASLMGFPVVEAEDMPDPGQDTTPIAFGDFRRGYLIVDRRGVRVLRDPYTQKPYVLFYTTKRVGGGVQDFDAIKLLKFSVS